MWLAALTATLLLTSEPPPVVSEPTSVVTEPQAALAAPAPVEPPSVAIEGNLVLPDEVYLAMLALEAVAGDDDPLSATQEAADHLADRTRDFLHNAGYELAAVAAHITDNRIVVVVDEGCLAKIVFKGMGTYRTFQLKATLDIPHRVYNRPQLMRQLAALRGKHGIIDIRMRLVPAKAVEHVGYQVEQLDIEGIATIPPPGDYELHVEIGRRDWRTGLHLHVGYEGSDGFRLGSSFIGFRLGLRERPLGCSRRHRRAGLPEPDGHDGPFTMSRGQVGVRYFTPPIASTGLRPSISTYADVVMQPRFDLGLVRYLWLTTGAVLFLGYEPFDGVSLSLGGGGERRELRDLNRLPSGASGPTLEPFVRNRWLIALQTEFLFDTDEQRLDRRHELTWDLRTYFADFEQFLWIAKGEYQRVYSLGWHDLRIEAAGAAMWGQVPFVEEEAVSRYVRGVFSDVFWVRSVASASAEFRYSLARDLYKVSVFGDVAAFEDPGPSRRRHQRRVATSTGLGFHMLLLDIAQVDFYVAYGAATNGERDWGVAASAAKAF